jgi:hypothetical protein
MKLFRDEENNKKAQRYWFVIPSLPPASDPKEMEVYEFAKAMEAAMRTSSYEYLYFHTHKDPEMAESLQPAFTYKQFEEMFGKHVKNARGWFNSCTMRGYIVPYKGELHFKSK